eukprot:14886310-Alexandrium_andersonii.AAC.1
MRFCAWAAWAMATAAALCTFSTGPGAMSRRSVKNGSGRRASRPYKTRRPASTSRGTFGGHPTSQ